VIFRPVDLLPGGRNTHEFTLVCAPRGVPLRDEIAIRPSGKCSEARGENSSSTESTMCLFLNCSVKRAVIALFVSDVLMFGVMMVSRSCCCVPSPDQTCSGPELQLSQNAHKMEIDRL
jgi:hypothetical protein